MSNDFITTEYSQQTEVDGNYYALLAYYVLPHPEDQIDGTEIAEYILGGPKHIASIVRASMREIDLASLMEFTSEDIINHLPVDILYGLGSGTLSSDSFNEALAATVEYWEGIRNTPGLGDPAILHAELEAALSTQQALYSINSRRNWYSGQEAAIISALASSTGSILRILGAYKENQIDKEWAQYLLTTDPHERSSIDRNPINSVLGKFMISLAMIGKFKDLRPLLEQKGIPALQRVRMLREILADNLLVEPEPEPVIEIEEIVPEITTIEKLEGDRADEEKPPGQDKPLRSMDYREIWGYIGVMRREGISTVFDTEFTGYLERKADEDNIKVIETKEGVYRLDFVNIDTMKSELESLEELVKILKVSDRETRARANIILSEVLDTYLYRFSEQMDGIFSIEKFKVDTWHPVYMQLYSHNKNTRGVHFKNAWRIRRNPPQLSASGTTVQSASHDTSRVTGNGVAGASFRTIPLRKEIEYDKNTALTTTEALEQLSIDLENNHDWILLKQEFLETLQGERDKDYNSAKFSVGEWIRGYQKLTPGISTIPGINIDIERVINILYDISVRPEYLSHERERINLLYDDNSTFYDTEFKDLLAKWQISVEKVAPPTLQNNANAVGVIKQFAPIYKEFMRLGFRREEMKEFLSLVLRIVRSKPLSRGRI